MLIPQSWSEVPQNFPLPGAVARAATACTSYTFLASLLNEKQLLALTALLSYQNPTKGYSQKKPEVLCLLRIIQGQVVIPRFVGLRVFGQAARSLVSEGDVLSPEKAAFCGTLFSLQPGSKKQVPQQEACDHIMALQRKGVQCGFLNLPCGCGKTICMANIISRTARATLILVTTAAQHKEALETVETFCPGLSVGLIREDVCELDRDVVIAFVETLRSPGRQFTSAQFVRFGVVFIDEAHHIAADTLSRLLMTLVRARYVYGLSATIRRGDGRTEALFHLIGPVLYSHVRPPEETAKVTVIQLVMPDNGRESRLRKGNRQQLDLPGMINDLCDDITRTSVGVRAIWEQFSKPLGEGERRRRFIAVSHRKANMEDVVRLIQKLAPGMHWVCYASEFYLGFAEEPAEGLNFEEVIESRSAAVSIGLLRGGQAPGKTPAALAWRIKIGSLLKCVDFVVSIIQLGSESFNSPEIDTEVLFTPCGDPEQIFGRTQRGHDGNNHPLIYDLVDDYDDMIRGLARKRFKMGESLGYNMQRHDLESPDFRHLMEPITGEIPVTRMIARPRPPRAPRAPRTSSSSSRKRTAAVVEDEIVNADADDEDHDGDNNDGEIEEDDDEGMEQEVLESGGSPPGEGEASDAPATPPPSTTRVTRRSSSLSPNQASTAVASCTSPPAFSSSDISKITAALAVKRSAPPPKRVKLAADVAGAKE